MDSMSFKAIDILYSAKQAGIEIVLLDDQLQLKLPQDIHINDNLLQQIRDNKKILIEYLSSHSLQSKTVDKNYNAITRIDKSSIPCIPLSFSQERLWFIDQMEGSVQYHRPEVLRLQGFVDKTALNNAFKTIVNRHEILRTIIHEENGRTCQSLKEIDNWQLEIVDGSLYQQNAEGLQQHINSLVKEPFDLSKDYMIRVWLITLGEQQHMLVMAIHHIASDGWSVSILIKELTELYAAYIENRAPLLEPLGLQYADYAIWQRQYLQGEVLDQKLSYWKEKLECATPLQLPTDYIRPIIQGTKGGSTSFTVDMNVSKGLQQVSLKQGATLFMTLLAAFKVLLYRYSGQEDISVGTSIADRHQKELEDLIGFFVNTLSLRSKVNGKASFIELLQQVKSTTLEAYEHQDVPFEKVVNAVVKERDMSRHPLFQVMLVLQNTPDAPLLQLGDATLFQEEVIYNTAKFDITFFITETHQGLQGAVEYSTDLYKPETVERMVKHFQELLSSIAGDPKQTIGNLSMLTSAEENQLLVEFNNKIVSYPRDKTVVNLFEEQVSKTPDSIAVVFEKEQLTYQQLNERANQVAHYLLSKGVTVETLVPICIERSAEMIVGILGILKAGGAYVPIDPSYPSERISFMLQDSAASVVISSQASQMHLTATPKLTIIKLDSDWASISQQPISNPQTHLSSHNLVYVIYTSGSTGTPKGVMISHSNLVDYVFGLQQNIPIGECRSFALVSGIATDLGNTVLYSSLLLGGALHLFSHEVINDGDMLQRYFRDRQIDCVKIVPSHWKALSAGDKPLLPLKMIIFGGEALQASLLENIKQSGSNCKIINHYGPTETTIGKLLHIVDNERVYNVTIPIGKPFSNTQVYVVSKELALCPVGIPGELCIGGEGVARGYRNNAELTHSKFISNPFNQSGSQLYRTGDLVKYLPDGNIEFIGRIDEQIKIRGYRIELGEIESVLLQSGLVQGVAVLSREDKSGGKQLVGYVVMEGFDQNASIDYLKNKLPEYMVPMVWVELGSFPLLSNGKIDRKALPDPEGAQGAEDKYLEPRNELEVNLVEIWQRLLEVERVGIRDNFFELGGHSLLAIQLISAIRRRLEIEVSIGDIFDYPTIESLAAKFDIQSGTSTPPPIKVQTRPERLPLSFSQERLWFIDRLEGSVQYHRPEVLRLNGEVNQTALHLALQSIINRHEVLRTVILEEEGEPYQYINEQDNWQLEIVDGSLYQQDSEGLRQYIDGLINIPFDLSKDHMIRVHLISLNEEEHLLVITIHHIVLDAWSIPILIKELTELYSANIENRPQILAPLGLQYADYAIWQRQYLQGEVLDQKLNYWKEKLEGAAPLQLPTDFPRPANHGTEGRSVYFNLNKVLSKGIQQLSLQQGATLFMTLLAAFKVLLYRYSGQEDISVGTSIADRQQQELEGLIGFFVNTLTLRSELKGDASFIELLQQVKLTTLEAYQHQDVPFEKVVNAVVMERDMSRHPLFQVMLVLQNTPDVPEFSFGGLNLSQEEFTYDIAKFDITFFITETPQGLQGAVTYSTDLYKPETVERMVKHFQELLSSIAGDPKQTIGNLSMLTSAEENQLLVAFNNKIVSYPRDKTVVNLFEEQVSKTPDSMAVVFEKEQLTYQQLNERANQLAHYLLSKGVTVEALVPICIERSAEMIIGILGILKAGAAYVPIDPAYPEERISFMLRDSEATIVVSNKQGRVHIPSHINIISLDSDLAAISTQSVSNPQTSLSAHNLAYVIYTSGSTGKPKGVMISHGNLVDYIFGLDKNIQISECRSYALVSSIATDLGNTVLYSSLLLGGALHLFSKEAVNNADGLQRYFRDEEIECVKIVPSHWKALCTHDLLLPSKMLIFGGEALQAGLVEEIRESGTKCKIINHYGPTETTIGKLLHVVKDDGENNDVTVPIGKPFSNTEIYIVNRDLSLCPLGIPGELCIGGDGVARGYRNNTELTASKFIANPFRQKGSLLYRTGDLVKYLPDGNIEFIGRIDEQVKIHGYRVELGEIENVLLQSGLVHGAAVLSREDKSGNKQLVGYVLTEGYFDRDTVIDYLKNKLPEYMVPMIWVELESFPLLSNGKIDRKVLPDPDAVTGSGDTYMEPRNGIEIKLVEIWQKLLEVERIGIRDNFFELGGHSLLAIQLISAIRRQLAVEVSIGDIFDYPTIESLAEKKDLSEFELVDI